MTEEVKPPSRPASSQFHKPRSLSLDDKPSESCPKPGPEEPRVKHGATTSPDSGKAAKSSAQVARLVAPNACGLKPDDKFGPLSGDETEDQADEAYEGDTGDEYDWESVEQDWKDKKPEAERAEELILQRILADKEWDKPEPKRPKIRSRSRWRLKRWIPTSGGGKAEPEKRPHPLGVRFSALDLEIVRAKAGMVGCSVNSYIRAAALGSEYRPPRDPELTKALLMVNREFTAQGNNLNQIARQLNAGIVTPAQAKSMVELLARSLLRTHKAVRQALAQGEPEP